MNLSSFAGKPGQLRLSVYSQTKPGMVGCTEAMSRELNSDGVKSIALGPGFFDAHASDFI